MKRWLASRLRRFAGWLDPPAAAPAPQLPPQDREIDPDVIPIGHVLPARQFAEELQLRNALKSALRRYHPTEEPGQA